jgi:hypothetical protein
MQFMNLLSVILEAPNLEFLSFFYDVTPSARQESNGANDNYRIGHHTDVPVQQLRREYGMESVFFVVSLLGKP